MGRSLEFYFMCFQPGNALEIQENPGKTLEFLTLGSVFQI